ncbi:MAG: tol-pal system protein YbgF [Hyphomicrobium sp.]
MIRFTTCAKPNLGVRLPVLAVAGLAVLAAALLMMPLTAQAQQGTAPAAAAAPDQKAAGAKAAAKPAVQAPAGGDGGLKSRVDSLEEQLVDMQVLVGTLESLAKSGGAAASAAPRVSAAGSGDGARVEALETQVRALSTQVQSLSDQVRSMGGTPRRSDAAPVGSSSGQPVNSQYSSTAVAGDDIGGLIDQGASGPPVVQAGGNATYGANTPDGAGSGAPPPPVTTAALPPPGDIANPKQLYETAYGYLLQRDYGAAEFAFDDFLKKFPSDSLAGNAQYWLGESHFVRGQYKAAASAFLKGYQTYAQSPKAPDSLLKLAMSLDRLGQKDAACSSYSELNTKFPNAAQNVKTRAQSERQRVGCP